MAELLDETLDIIEQTQAHFVDCSPDAPVGGFSSGASSRPTLDRRATHRRTKRVHGLSSLHGEESALRT